VVTLPNEIDPVSIASESYAVSDRAVEPLD
jgi:hypothetical protein